MGPELTEDERQAVCKLLRNAIDADRYRLSERVRTWKSALAKLDPGSMRPEPKPPQPAGPTRTRGGGRR
jgi:hypothetical protein